MLLVHGWEGCATQLGAFVEPLTRAGFRVVGFDGPAHGRSLGERTDMPTLAAALRTVADAVGPLSAVIAHSMGGSAAALALGQGLQAEAAVLIASPASLEDVRRRFVAFTALAPEAERELLRLFEARYKRESWRTLSPDHVLTRVAAPGLTVHDEDDREVPFEDAHKLLRAWPRARLLCTQGLGHRRVFRDPGVIAEVVRFLVEKRAAALPAAGWRATG